MAIVKYDDFSHTNLCAITFLEDISTLMLVIKNASSYQIIFENSEISTLVLPRTKITPVLVFESTKQIVFAVGRSQIDYDFNRNSVSIHPYRKSQEFLWQSLKIIIEYRIIETLIFITSEAIHKCHKIDGDIWKIINFCSDIYIFSDSINKVLSITKIDQDGEIHYIYTDTTTHYLIKLQQLLDPLNCPLLVCSPEKNLPKKAILFIHGGPHQKSGNIWDYLINGLLNKGFLVYIPQYIGTIGVDNDTAHDPAYGIGDFNEIHKTYNQIKNLHETVVILGHSYGAFLSLKLFLNSDAEIIIGLNGIYDLQTIAELNPKTYGHLDQSDLIIRSPKISKSLWKKGEWHHIQFLKDPAISLTNLKRSIERVGNIKPQIHLLDYYGHGLFNQIQATSIINKIDFILDQLGNKKLCDWKT